MPLLLGIPWWLWGVTGAGTVGLASGAYLASGEDLSTDPEVLEAQRLLLEAQKKWYEDPILIGIITIPLAAVVIMRVVK